MEESGAGVFESRDVDLEGRKALLGNRRQLIWWRSINRAASWKSSRAV